MKFTANDQIVLMTKSEGMLLLYKTMQLEVDIFNCTEFCQFLRSYRADHYQCWPVSILCSGKLLTAKYSRFGILTVNHKYPVVFLLLYTHLSVVNSVKYFGAKHVYFT